MFKSQIASLCPNLRASSITLAVVLLSLAAPGWAGVIDPAGDFLSTYTGPQNADLDVRSVDFSLRDDTFTFSGTLAGPISDAGALYIFGVNRGAGTARFTTGTPSIGQGVLFDSVAVAQADGTGFVNDIIGGMMTPLPDSDITISGATITAQVPASLLPSQGLLPSQYTTNLWPRLGPQSNARISDFAPDASNVSVQDVPEPGTLSMFVLSVVGVAATASYRRRRKTPAAG